MIYYIADMHFGHTNVLRFDNRPFSDTAQMDDTLIQNWNVLFCFSTVFANGIKAHNIAKAPVTVSLRERRLQVLFLFRCCL